MALDAYSLCPGGTGKKIKFCCPDMLPDLQAIERMLEGEQFRACLEHIEKLEKDHPGRPCLLATKALLLRIQERLDEAEAVVAEFLAKHPDNPLALAEHAILVAANQGGRAAMKPLQASLAASGDELSARVYEMLGTVGQILMFEGEVMAARNVLTFQAMAHRQDPRPLSMLAELNASRNIPIWVKDERRIAEPPADAPWRNGFLEAVGPLRHGQWTESAERLLALTEQYGEVPAIWRALATLRSWTADRAGAIEAYRKYASLDVPAEDAAEATAVAMWLSDDPLGDGVNVLRVTYAVTNPDEIFAAFSASKRLVMLRADLAAMAQEGAPPPRAAYYVFDREPTAEAPSRWEDLPQGLARLLLYGKETDREARLEIEGVLSSRLDELMQVLRETAQNSLGDLISQEIVDQVSASHELFGRNWRVPDEIEPGKLTEFAAAHEREVVLNRWPATPLGLLDGKTPAEAAGQKDYRARVLAAVLFLRMWTDDSPVRVDLNELRSRLGLPTLDAIDPTASPIPSLPASRLERVIVEKLSDEDLVQAQRYAVRAAATAAIRKFSQEIVNRPSLAGKEEQLDAYAVLVRLAEDLDVALEYIDRGRAAAEAAGGSSANWDVMELSLRFQRMEAEEIGRLLRHLQTQHMREPGVAMAVQQILMQHGLIREDGSPAFPPGAMQAGPAGVPDATEAHAEPGKLWTPDGQSAGDKPKLWMPGME